MADLIDYQPVDSATYETSLASNPKAVLKGPGIRDWFITMHVGKRSYDVVEMIDAILKAWLLHPDTEWNLPFPRTEHVIDTKLQPDDLDALSAELSKKLYPHVFNVQPEAADPNALAPEEETTPATPPTATSTRRKSGATRS